ncbi:MAG: hypothetical protein SWC96_14480 [Thermodesulfobacteriota bacterium]|uniref:Uncharacterized protein n=1 Tax=Desulfosudis oleivorans (strain DSM 6200 / JCM 39069 / Hxd3) TaxID=96561 RepID=A8ZUR9_DESOH|nr:hypothetical protein [Desulfosudis oleivorans]ABW66482.1 hypothetical protein Dole_0672 [Desulfosudis oleivorans Hxd3]MDY6833020.1 hypothetical protein [Thermodesulfobacteriota bacterium]
MSIARLLGTMVVFGVPAIIGGGIVFHFMGNYTAVFTYEFMLLLAAGGFIAR